VGRASRHRSALRICLARQIAMLAAVLATQLFAAKPPDASVDAGIAPVRRPFELFAPGADEVSPYPVRIKVGEEADIDAGDAQGVLCDDTTFFEMTTEGTSHLIFKGLKHGSTLCRIGVPRSGFPNRLVLLEVNDEKPQANGGQDASR
jgi:hypothetical protein